MFAMLVIPQSVIIAVIGIAVIVFLAVHLLPAALGARPAVRRPRALWTGFAAGAGLSLLVAWLMWGELPGTVVAAPFLGAVVSFAVARSVARSDPRA
jgi:hypothetical protein